MLRGDSVKLASICHSLVEQELLHLATQASGFLDRLYPDGRLRRVSNTAHAAAAAFVFVHGVSKNDTDVAHYNFNPHQPTFLIFDRDVAERVCYQMVICYPTSPN